MSWGLLRGGCEARSEIFVRLLKEDGVTNAHKAWAFSTSWIQQQSGVELSQNEYWNGMIPARVMRDEPDSFRWPFHIAVALPVATHNGATEIYVLDPSLFNGPVTVKQWAAVMGLNTSQIDITPPGQPPRFSRDDYLPGPEVYLPDARLLKALRFLTAAYQRNQSENGTAPRRVHPSPKRAAMCANKNLHCNQTGTTWQTITP